MDRIIFHTAYSKDLLRNLLNLKLTKFKEWMKTVREPTEKQTDRKDCRG